MNWVSVEIEIPQLSHSNAKYEAFTPIMSHILHKILDAYGGY